MCLRHYQFVDHNECKKVLSVLNLTKYGKIDISSYRSHRILTLEDFLHYNKKSECYVVYSDPEIPIIKTDLYAITANIDDILAVSFDTWIIFDDYSLIVEFFHDGVITAVNI
jgi:hypothetical protein